ncbi:MAG: BCCT family transporter [Pseudomonadota bacterium]|nr:BCCT family transporter [Pseudomonadota bacterium]
MQTNTAPLDRKVFIFSVSLLALTVGFAALAPDLANAWFESLQIAIVANASWYYVGVVAIILLTCIGLAVTRFGDIRLGPDHAEPEYSVVSWFAMLFAAGMGIGLMFFGVAEPVVHFLDPPNAEGGNIAAAREALKITFFHWGLHAWGIYAIVAAILAYFSFRHDLPLTLRSALYPIIGERIHGGLGTAVDVFAIVSTIFGVATSLGFGVAQINSGLNYLFDLPNALGVQIGLIIITTALATVSVVLGLDKGIKRLSEANIALAVLLLLGILVLGPTVYLLQMFMQNTGHYAADIVSKTFNLFAYQPTEWLGGWTIFYWGWWVSWAPFVGLFIARISRGRTLREFVAGVLLAPTLFTFLWMTVFGNSAIELILDQGADALAQAVRADESVALFQFLTYFPYAQVLSGLAVMMVFIFFITSADSGAMVLNMLSSYGRDDTPAMRRFFWMGAIGVVAIVLLLAGGLSALQTAAVASALPFSLAIMFAIWGFLRALSTDHAKRLVQAANTIGPSGGARSSEWQVRLKNVLTRRNRDEIQAFIDHIVQPALSSFKDELTSLGTDASVHREPDAVVLLVTHGEEPEFLYRVEVSTSQASEMQNLYRAEVHLTEGSQYYDIMGWTEAQVIHNVLEHYEKHQHFLHISR